MPKCKENPRTYLDTLPTPYTCCNACINKVDHAHGQTRSHSLGPTNEPHVEGRVRLTRQMVHT